MATLLDGLLLYLRLDQIENGRVLDLSGQANPGTIRGNPRLVADQTFGSCLSFDGQHDAIDLPAAAIPTGQQATVSVWLNGAASLPQAASVFEAVDAKGIRVLNLHVPWSDSSVYFDAGNDETNFDRIQQAAQPADFKGSWVHWAFVKNAAVGEMHVYRNGVHWLGGTGLTRALPAAVVARLGSFSDGTVPYPGQIAHFRIYNRALAPDEIGQLILDDETAIASFRVSYPLDFELNNDNDEPVLYITPMQHNLHLDVTNSSTRALTFQAPGAGSVSFTNYHLALSFRPGALAPLVAEQTGVKQVSAGLSAGGTHTPLPPGEAAGNWTSTIVADADGTTTIYLLCSAAFTLQPNTMTMLTLPDISADGLGGARGTRVEILYQNVIYPNEMQPIQGTRLVHLSILDQSGQKQIPLHAGFIASNRILNDGSARSSLTLRVTNILQTQAIGLNPSTSANPTRFVLSFDVQSESQTREWALGTASQVAAIAVAAADGNSWKVTPQTQGESPEWIITTPTKTSLKAGEAIQIGLDSIVSSLPSGPTNLYIHYENIPGYWDGQLVAAIEKSPLLVRGTNGSMINVGTPAPFFDYVKLAVSATNSHFQARRESTETTGGNIVFLEAMQDETNPPKVPEVHPSVRLHHRNRFWHRIEGRPDGIHIKDGDTANEGYRNLFAADLHSTNSYIGGQAAIGTTSLPAGQKLTISSTATHLQLRRENTETAGGTTLYLELYQDDPSNHVPEVHPAIRFHHNNKFWWRIEGQPNGFHFKDGNLASDSHADIHANNGQFDGSVVLGDPSRNFIRRTTNYTFPAENFTCPSGGSHSQWTGSVEGPCIYGATGGVLGTTANGEKITLYWDSNGNVRVRGYIAAETKFFRIDHPLKPDHELFHGCVEGPENGVYYRGEAQLVAGEARVLLPEYFEALTRKEGRTVQLTAKGKQPFLLSYEDVADGAFRVCGTKSDGRFAWEVKAVRADVSVLAVEVKK
jgi:hypothetical protein